MVDIIDVHKAVCILEETTGVFTKEQLDILYSLEKQRVDNALPQIEKAMRKICSSLMCKWVLTASYLDGKGWTIQITRNSRRSTKGSDVNLTQVYDQINMLKDLGLPIGKEQMGIVREAENNYVEDNIISCLKDNLNQLIPCTISGLCLEITIKPKGDFKCGLASRPVSSTHERNDHKSKQSNGVLVPSKFSNVDTKKLQGVFDKKVTTYKYFWFYAIVSILNETEGRTIAITDIIARMIATAWPLVNSSHLDFGQADALPKYIRDILGNTSLSIDSTQEDVFIYLKENKNIPSVKAAINKLKTNVPFRFLTPWVRYISDDQMMADSLSPHSGCPYAISAEYITIHNGWDKYVRANGNQLCSFIMQSLSAYLERFNNPNTPLH